MTDKFTHIPAAYEIVSLEYIDEIKSQAALLRHRKTGARIAVLANDDENKTFNIGFRTPPKDSTGVAHIMEHSVLCGSEKFPGFLDRSSLYSFMNVLSRASFLVPALVSPYPLQSKTSSRSTLASTSPMLSPRALSVVPFIVSPPPVPG